MSKYDRQLRLWGHEGQKSLSNAHILVLTANVTSIESLKNLILPNIGQFTLIDKEHVTINDIETNFYCQKEDLHQLRGECVTKALLEINPDVNGTFMEKDPFQVISEDPTFFQSFDLIIASQLPSHMTLLLSQICEKYKVPLLIANIYGMIGYLRTQYTDLEIIDAQPNKEIEVLRLAYPTKAFITFADSFNFETMDSLDFAHVPYPILLYKALQVYRRQCSSNLLPKTEKEKAAFREAIVSLCPDASKREKLQNFQEALQNAYKAYTIETVKSDILNEIFENEKCISMRKDIIKHLNPFWLVIRGISMFQKQRQQTYNITSLLLPYTGHLSDMIATTEYYIKLQEIYHQASIEEIEEIYQNVLLLQKELKLSHLKIEQEYVKEMIKNIQCLRYMQTRTLTEEMHDPKLDEVLDQLEMDMSNPQQHPFLWYILIRLSETFRLQYGHYPGEKEVEEKLPLQQCRDKFFASLLARNVKWTNILELVKDEHLLELIRFNNIELHTIGAIMGAMIAQESTKILTRKYVPLNNTYLYNGITGNASVYEI